MADDNGFDWCGSVRRGDVYVYENDPVSQLEELFKMFRPELAAFPVHIEELTGGLINVMYKFVSADDVTVFRIYNSDLTAMFDREKELKRLLFLHEQGLYQKIYGVFRNGICYRYQTGESLTAEDLRDPAISRRIAKKLALLHTACLEKMEGIATDDAISSIISHFDILPDTYENPSLHQMISACFPNRLELRAEFDQLVHELMPLRTRAESGDLVLCHNDLVPSNIIYDQTSDEVYFIDFEFAGYGYAADEVGGLFAEFFGGTEVVCDESVKLEDSSQMDFIKHYLETRREISPRNVTENSTEQKPVPVQKPVPYDDVWNFYVLSKKFALLRPWYAFTWILNAVSRIRDPKEALDDLLMNTFGNASCKLSLANQQTNCTKYTLRRSSGRFAKNGLDNYRKAKDSALQLRFH